MFCRIMWMFRSKLRISEVCIAQEAELRSDNFCVLCSRNSENNTVKYPDIAAAVPGLIKEGVKSVVLDCEAVAFERETGRILPFQVLSCFATLHSFLTIPFLQNLPDIVLNLTGKCLTFAFSIQQCCLKESDAIGMRYIKACSAISNHLRRQEPWVVAGVNSVMLKGPAKHCRCLQVLSTRKRKDVEVADIKVQVCLFAFDCLYLNGDMLLQRPLTERRAALLEAVEEKPGELQYALYKV